MLSDIYMQIILVIDIGMLFDTILTLLGMTDDSAKRNVILDYFSHFKCFDKLFKNSKFAKGIMPSIMVFAPVIHIFTVYIFSRHFYLHCSFNMHKKIK